LPEVWEKDSISKQIPSYNWVKVFLKSP